MKLHLLTVLLFEICMWKALGTLLCSLAAKVYRLTDISRKMFDDLSEFWKVSHISDLFNVEENCTSSCKPEITGGWL